MRSFTRQQHAALTVGPAHTCTRSKRVIRVKAVIEVPTAAVIKHAAPVAKYSIPQQPAWTDADHISSKLANWIITTRPTYALATWLARREMITTAKQAGLDVRQHIQQMEQHRTELEQLHQQFINSTPHIQSYPDYYLRTFHGYQDGNLSWQAAFEMDPISHAVALRCFKGQGLSAREAMAKLRHGYNTQIQAYYIQHRLAPPQRLLDIGCSTGISSCWYQQLFPAANISGLDLSPHFLAVAQLAQRVIQWIYACHSADDDHSTFAMAHIPSCRHRLQQAKWQQAQSSTKQSSQHITFVQGLAESTGFPSHSFELVLFSFVAHECPQAATQDMIREARRILTPGGVVCFLDNNPHSSVLQSLPPWLAILVKSGEPWTDEYYSMDMVEELRAAGFKNVAFTEANGRHCTVFGMA